MKYPNSTLSFHQTKRSISNSNILTDEQKTEFRGVFDFVRVLEDFPLWRFLAGFATLTHGG